MVSNIQYHSSITAYAIIISNTFMMFVGVPVPRIAEVSVQMITRSTCMTLSISITCRLKTHIYQALCILKIWL